jgi:hypothetical protein
MERAREILKQFFRSFQPSRPWCYALNLVDNDTNNVSDLLGLNSNELETLFKTADVLKAHGTAGIYRMNHKTMEAIVASVDHAEYLTYCGKRYLKLGEGMWSMNLQSDERGGAPHVSMSEEMKGPRAQLKQANDEL